MRFDSSETSQSIDNSKIQFPRFIPDDPEQPHLSSTIREKARRLVIREFIKQTLQNQGKSGKHVQLSPLERTVFNDERNAQLTLWQRIQMDILADNSILTTQNNELKAQRERKMREEASKRARSVAFTNLEKRKSKNSNGRTAPRSRMSKLDLSNTGSGIPSQQQSQAMFSDGKNVSF